MNQAQAHKEGLVFTGATADTWNKEECAQLRKEAAEIRKLGFKAIIVQSGVKEWGCGSKLLYTDKGYRDYEHACQCKSFCNNYERDRQRIIEKYEAELKQLDERHAQDEAFIAEVEKKFGVEVK